MTTMTTRAPPAAWLGASHSAADGAHPVSATGARGHGHRRDNYSDAQSTASSTSDFINDKAAGPALTKRQRVRRHCGQFWLWYLIAAVVFLIIFLPILFMVILPAVVQNIINSQTLPVERGRMDCISATQFRLALNTSLDAPMPARIGEFTLGLHNRDTSSSSPSPPFANITIAGQMINGHTKVVVPSQLLTIQNETELVHYLDQVLNSKEVQLTVDGRPKVHLGALSSTARIDKTISMPALNKFAGLAITDMRMVFPPDKSGNNMRGTLNIPNAGTLSLNLGNMSFDLFSGPSKLGQLTVYNVLLNEGDNAMDFDGTLDMASLMKNVGSVLHSQKQALNRGQIELNVTGTAVTFYGERIPYVEKVLAKTPLTANMPVTALLGDVLGGFMGGATGGGGGLGIGGGGIGGGIGG
ncbi:hypothetical protein E4U41_002983, partial [Claviceps citrina]